MRRDFASDNNAGVHPEVMAAIATANSGHVRAYGDDAVTEAAVAKLREHFGERTEAFFVFGGTGANVLGLKAITEPHHAILCANSAHIYRDECGAPERFTGCKLNPVEAPNGKIEIESLKPWLADKGSEHHNQPRVLSITQSTELGTVYRPEEIAKLSEFCRQHELYLHVDGARLANAAASLGVGLRAITTDVGVDVVTLGGTKNGILGGEAVLFLNGLRAKDFKWLRKQAMQLPSKMRFVAAQFLALFTNELWLRNASHSNAMAKRLAAGLIAAKVRVAFPVESNGVFAYLRSDTIEELQRQAYFYVWDETETLEPDGTLLTRLMTSFDTTEEDVDTFVVEARRLSSR
jgi:threonine aldolase